MPVEKGARGTGETIFTKRRLGPVVTSHSGRFFVRFALCFARFSHEYVIFASKIELAQHKTDEKSTQSTRDDRP
jgi:hypothetical protein